jgi:cell wall-associated NlpC family hydrolase
MRQIAVVFLAALLATTGRAQDDSAARVATLDPADIVDFTAQPPAIQRLLTEALRLTKLNLSYKYGSSDPAAGGMDCSGTVHHLLQQAGIADAPRDSSEMYRWVWTEGTFHAVVSSNPDTFELAKLKPGDLLFWSGTYHITRDPPVTHVMIYLGREKQTGHRVMVGASEGRRFHGVSRYGVSVFDFEMPRTTDADTPGDHPRFIGYGAIPGIENREAAGGQ